MVISLDLELHWGVRDWCAPDDGYIANLIGEREAVSRLLDAFAQSDVAATWATVGFLFARTQDVLRRFTPKFLPTYDDERLNPYTEGTGTDEDVDPLHFGAGLVDRIQAAPDQEIATHTFSHFYTLEPGQSVEAFRADIASACRIAAERGVQIRSIAFPRNQVNPRYLPVLLEQGITAYRGNQRGWAHHEGAASEKSTLRRGVRLVDAHVSICGDGTTAWADVRDATGLCNIPASRFLRPYSGTDKALGGLRLRRITEAMDRAAIGDRIFHLWWHPHNFGADTNVNLAFLQRILDRYRYNRDRHGMQSLNMRQIASAASGQSAHQ